VAIAWTNSQEMGSELKDLEAESATASKQLIKANAAWEHKKESRKAEETTRDGLLTAIADVRLPLLTLGCAFPSPPHLC